MSWPPIQDVDGVLDESKVNRSKLEEDDLDILDGDAQSTRSQCRKGTLGGSGK